MTQLSGGPVAPANVVYLPAVHGDGPAAAAQPETGLAAIELYYRIRDHTEQQRPRLVWDDALARVAALRCKDMRTRAYFGHTDPEGYGPNVFAMGHGINLPDWYSQSRAANNIESIGLHQLEPALMLAMWLDSLHHREHILGMGDFFGGQERCGVGVCPTWESPPAQFIYCFLACH